jgi:Family of unknown function (DUF6058)
MPRPSSRDVGLAPPRLSRDDALYVRTRFVTLAQLARSSGVAERQLRTAQERGQFPLPTYVTDENEGWYPPAYAVPLRQAVERRTTLRDLFRQKFLGRLSELEHRDPRLHSLLRRAEGGKMRRPGTVERSYWAAFVTGEYGACLRVPWVPAIIRKEQLLDEIGTLLGQPAPGVPAWDRRLRRAVDALDRLEMPFAQWDRTRFGGPVTRDTHIDSIRRRFPDVFAPRGVAPRRDRTSRSAFGFREPSTRSSEVSGVDRGRAPDRRARDATTFRADDMYPFRRA